MEYLSTVVCIVIIILISVWLFNWIVAFSVCEEILGYSLPRHGVSVKKTGMKNTPLFVGRAIWRTGKLDGSHDNRYKDFSIIRQPSVFTYNGITVSSTNTVFMIMLVNYMRKHGSPVMLSPEEESKRQMVLKNLYERQALKKAKDIYDYFCNSPIDFEVYCGNLFSNDGYDVEHTSATNDGGYDLFLKRNGERALVECKCYQEKNLVGRPLIQKLVGANASVQAEHLFFITTSDFTKGAREYAVEAGVCLINGKMLAEIGGMTKQPFIQDELCWLTPKDAVKFFPPDVRLLGVSAANKMMKYVKKLY